jgi:hypothetical protein
VYGTVQRQIVNYNYFDLCIYFFKVDVSCDAEDGSDEEDEEMETDSSIQGLLDKLCDAQHSTSFHNRLANNKVLI